MNHLSKTGEGYALSPNRLHVLALLLIAALGFSGGGCARLVAMTPVAFDAPAHELPLHVEDLEYIIPEPEVDWGWEQGDKTFAEADASSGVPAIWPVDHPDMQIISRFGVRRGSHRGVVRRHMGLDIKAPTNVPVLAAADGRVTTCRTERRYGKMIHIEHENGHETLYAHLNAILVKPGQLVTQGELIGKVGRTGNATTAHLHYEVIVNGRHQNPEDYLPILN